MDEQNLTIKQSLVLYFYHHTYLFKVALSSCRKSLKPRHIHDLRLALKNLTALLLLLHELEPRKKINPWNPDKLNRLFRIMGELRDIQVLQSELKKKEKILKIRFSGFRKIIRNDEKALSGKLKPMLRIAKYETELQGVKSYMERVTEKSGGEAVLEKRILKYILRSWKEIRVMMTRPHTARNLHSIRIDLKHINYILMVLKQKGLMAGKERYDRE